MQFPVTGKFATGAQDDSGEFLPVLMTHALINDNIIRLTAP
jgi:hypothetical protein